MKRFCSLLLALIIVLSCVSALAARIPDELPVGKLNSAARLYKENSTKNGTVATLKSDAEVKIIGETKSFYWVVSGNMAGYILKDYVDVENTDLEKITELINSLNNDTKRLGSSKNPGKVGDTLIQRRLAIELDASGKLIKADVLTLQIKFVGVARGQQAAAKIDEILKSHNRRLQPGYEEGIFEFEITVTKDPLNREEGYSVSGSPSPTISDKTFKATGSVYARNPIWGQPFPRLHEGDTQTVFFISDQFTSEDCYVVFNFDGFDAETVWFKF